VTAATEPRAPWHDTPTCPLERSGSPCGGPLTAADELLGSGELWCCACGRKSEATPEQVAQARRADAAWEVEQDRSEIRHWLTYGDELLRLEVEALTLAAMRVEVDGWTHGEIRDAVAVVLAAAGWKVGESALTAGSKIRHLGMKGTPVQLPGRIKEVVFTFTVGAQGLSTQDIRAAAATLAADSVKPDADGIVSIPVLLRCQECEAIGARACSYKCGAVLCEAHGAEHQPPDCPPQMDEYLRDTAAPEPGWVRDPLFGVSTEDGE